MHLPFAFLSDEAGRLRTALGLPVFTFDGMELLKRLTLISRDGMIVHVFYPVFPPDRSAAEVLAYLQSR